MSARGAGTEPPVPDWLADPALSRLWDVARNRLERSHLVPAGRVVLTGLERAERHAIGGLLATPVVRDRVRLDLAELDQMIARRTSFRGLNEVVVSLTGRPLHDRLAERSAAIAAREEPLALARALVAAEPRLAGRTWLESWLAAIRRSGVLGRAHDPDAAVRGALAAMAEILTRGAMAVSRTDLAARMTGSAHGLDDGTAAAQLVLRALAFDTGIESPLSAGERRDLWERYGVSADTVSTTCLTLGVRALGGGSVARRLRLAAEAGEPVHVTPRDLRDLDFAAHKDLLVCENPRVLEAMADRFGGDMPVVCTAGQPRLVTLAVLRRLAGAGATLRYHGDFDWPGLAIANRLITEVGTEPLLMAAADYQAAARRGDAVLELTGTPVTATWDPVLTKIMQRLGVAVHEELVLEDLLARVAESG